MSSVKFEKPLNQILIQLWLFIRFNFIVKSICYEYLLFFFIGDSIDCFNGDIEYIEPGSYNGWTCAMKIT